jgi:ClpP class serine protease
VAASGGYFLALAGDEIYADPSSIVGSIGVISAGFGFDRALDRLGIDRRIYTSGTAKGTLDPFSPERPDDIARLKALQKDVHDLFIGIVKERRRQRLTADDAEVFSGAFWSGPRAHEMGLIDGLADLRTKMREVHGDRVRLRVIPLQAGGLFGRLRRLPQLAEGGATAFSMTSADDLISSIEARALWARFGL